MSEPRVIHVDIQGQRFAIKSTLDPKYVHDVAAYVDHKMDRVGRELTSTSDAMRLAVLAALNIADELFRSRQDAGGETARLMARAAEIERLVDAALDAARTEASVADAARSGAGARAGRSNAL
jgi:cell division protein ZapA